MVEDPDRSLILRCQQASGEEYEEAFDELYRRHRDTVYSIAFRVTGDGSEALDAAQEAFLVLYRKLHSFQFESKFTSWLFRLVANAAIDHLRRHKKAGPGMISMERFVVDRDGGESGVEDSLGLIDRSQAGPQELAEIQEEQDLLQRGLLELSPKLRLVTILRYQQQLSYEEIAETLQVSIGTVKSRLSRAHLALSEWLREEESGLVPEQDEGNEDRKFRKNRESEA